MPYIERFQTRNNSVKLLLDENLPHELRQLIPGHAVFTVAFMHYDGLSNGRLLERAAADGFDAMLSLDSGLEQQRNLSTLPCAIVLIRGRSNRVADLSPLLPGIIDALKTLKPQTLVTVG